jgi:hypothetical protein
MVSCNSNFKAMQSRFNPNPTQCNPIQDSHIDFNMYVNVNYLPLDATEGPEVKSRPYLGTQEVKASRQMFIRSAAQNLCHQIGHHVFSDAVDKKDITIQSHQPD